MDRLSESMVLKSALPAEGPPAVRRRTRVPVFGSRPAPVLGCSVKLDTGHPSQARSPSPIPKPDPQGQEPMFDASPSQLGRSVRLLTDVAGSWFAATWFAGTWADVTWLDVNWPAATGPAATGPAATGPASLGLPHWACLIGPALPCPPCPTGSRNRISQEPEQIGCRHDGTAQRGGPTVPPPDWIHGSNCGWIGTAAVPPQGENLFCSKYR